MKKSRLSYGKFLSLVLRHKPETIGITLDPQGWADIESLLFGCRKKGLELDRVKLYRIMEADDKQRFQFSLDGLNVRACQGHTIPVDLKLDPIAPPDRLYHNRTNPLRKPVDLAIRRFNHPFPGFVYNPPLIVLLDPG